jgi:5'-phosphate synthase pdxT subunit
VEAVDVRRPPDLDGIDGIVIPGGESTTISMLLGRAELFDPLAELLHQGLPALGTCAGMILLASEVVDGRPDQRCFGAVDLTVRRNAFGRQVDSFETDLAVDGFTEPYRAVFIRAPWVERVGHGVEVLATVQRSDGEEPHPVLCRQGPVLVSSFHPELTADTRIHRCFLDLAA